MQYLRLKIRILILAILTTLLLIPISISAQRNNDSNCAATPDQLLGQAFGGFAGAEGETSSNNITPQGEDILDTNLDANSDWVMNNLVYSGSGSNRVALLIIDDFSSDGSGDIPASHGWLVHDVLTQLHNKLSDNIRNNIQLEQIDIAGANGYSSEFIETTLENRIAELNADGVTRFVVNMSFIIIPCQDTALGFDFDNFLSVRSENSEHSIIAELGDDADYVRGLLNNPNVVYIEESGLIDSVPQERQRGNNAESRPQGNENANFRQDELDILKLFENRRLQSDPLRAFFRENNNRNQILIPVASSGNFKGRQPLFPARWTEVISVSAMEGDNLRFWTQSNNGEVTTPGAWYLFEDGVYRAGTSFAAPVVSLLIAVDLTQDNQTCSSQGNMHPFTRNNFDNTPLLDAVERC